MKRRGYVSALVGALLLALALAAPVAASAASTVVRTGLPNHTLTPGVYNPAVTQATIRSTICVSGWTTRVRPSTSYTNALKVKQIAIYGYADKVVSDYEEDHFVPLELGGSPTSAKNLWPEPHHIKLTYGQDVGSYAKDALETHLKSLVCAGRLTLAAARHEIITNWVLYWRQWKGLPVSAAPTATPAPTPAPTATPASTLPSSVGAAKAAGASAVCNDGTWSYSASRSGTCSRHGGVYWWTGNLGPAGPG